MVFKSLYDVFDGFFMIVFWGVCRFGIRYGRFLRITIYPSMLAMALCSTISCISQHAIVDSVVIYSV